MSEKLGRNERCWCGSGKKFKRCHLGREHQSPPSKQEHLKRFNAAFENGHCLHPDAGPGNCTKGIIKAHTIQRNGALNRIARSGHVFSLLKHGKQFNQQRFQPNSEPHKVGIREASTFTGFCARHDSELFAPIEKEAFSATVSKVALLGYRGLCYEVFMKQSSLRAIELQQEQDKGEPISYQLLHQKALFYRKKGIEKAIEELAGQKALYESVIFKNRVNDLGYYVVHIDEVPEVQCCGIVQATHDFRGNKISELGRLEQPSNLIAFSLIPTDSGGAAVFSWPAGHSKSEDVFRTFHKLNNLALPHAIIRFTFEFFENTYFSPVWWDGLDELTQVSLKKRQLRELIGLFGEQDFPRSDGCSVR